MTIYSKYDELFNDEQEVITDDYEIELSLIAMLLIEKYELLPMYSSNLKFHYWKDDILREIVKFTLKLYTKDNIIATVPMLRSELFKDLKIRKFKNKDMDEIIEDTLEELEEKIKVLPEGTVSYCLKELREFVRRQTWKKTVHEMAVKLDEYKLEEIPELIDKMSLPIAESLDRGIFVFKTTELPLENFQTVPTGFSELDKHIKGGLGKEKLGILAAVSNLGKTWLMCRFAAGALMEGKNVFHYITEDTEEELLERYLQTFAITQELRAVEGTTKLTSKVLKSLKRFAKRGGNLIVRKIEPPTGNTIDNHIKQVESLDKIKPDLVLVDMVNDMFPNENNRNLARDEKYGEVCLNLFRIAHKFRVPVWAVVQMAKKALHKQRATGEDIGESWKIFVKGTIVLIAQQTAEEKSVNLFRITIEKNKQGKALASIPIKYNFGKGANIESVTKGEYETILSEAKKESSYE